MTSAPTRKKSAKLSDVAKKAGVSQGTVSNVFNRPEVVREQVREHVLKTAEALGYRGPDPRGRLLRAGKVNAIGIATAEPISYFFTDPYAREVLKGIAETCDANGTGISLVSAANNEALTWNIRSALVDGFILFCIENGAYLVRLTRERGLPFVALSLGPDDETVRTLGVDNVEGGRLAARHLADLGHRTFAVLTIPVDATGHSGPVSAERVAAGIYLTTRDRLAGYFEVLRARGIETDAVPLYETHNDEPTVYAAMAGIFARPDPPTAILAQSDQAALIAIRWLKEHGLDVPRDVSVIGFDGTEEGAAFLPPLTTVAQPMREIGRRAVRAILAPSRGVTRETLPVSLVVRGSTGPPPA